MTKTKPLSDVFGVAIIFMIIISICACLYAVGPVVTSWVTGLPIDHPCLMSREKAICLSIYPVNHK